MEPGVATERRQRTNRRCMKRNHFTQTIIGTVCFAPLIMLGLSGCGEPAPSATAPAPDATRTLKETSWKDFPIADFDAVHSPIPNDAYGRLIFGAVPVSDPPAGLAPELAVFLGRWEGYDYSPPVKKDHKAVLLVREISPLGGKAYMWTGTNLQYPYWVKEIEFRVTSGPTTVIEWEGDLAGAPGVTGGKGTFRFACDPKRQELRGGVNVPASAVLDGTLRLTRAETFAVYEDYAAYLASIRIEAKPHGAAGLDSFGAGYLVYLPEEYESDSEEVWPLLLFLHGYGDRGENMFLIAKASPFMMIRGRRPLPFLIAAPLLNANRAYATFPEPYLEGFLEEMLSEYRVDRSRIYLTGLSMGGEATYRFALNRPGMFAAISPLAGFNPKYSPAALQGGYRAFADRLKGVPVWAISGAEDTVVPLSVVQPTVDEFKAAGVDITLTVLADHDHDVWTDTYSDPEYYEWFLQFRKT
jgi:predicted esterase